MSCLTGLPRPAEEKLTNRNHTLAIIIQILHQSLAKTVHFSLSALRMIPRQEPALLLQSAHEIRQLLHHTLVRAKIFLLGEYNAEIEDELVAVVPWRLDADGVAQDAISIRAYLDQVPAEFLSGDHEEGDVGECEIQGLRGTGWRGYNGAVGDLVDDFGPWLC